MLPAHARMRRRDEFASTIRSGRRGSSPALVVHARLGGVGHVGFIVSRSVGGAVVRNRVRRQLRHLVAERLPLSPVADVVIRALPASPDLSASALRGELDRAWRRAGLEVPA